MSTLARLKYGYLLSLGSVSGKDLNTDFFPIPGVDISTQFPELARVTHRVTRFFLPLFINIHESFLKFFIEKYPKPLFYLLTSYFRRLSLHFTDPTTQICPDHDQVNPFSQDKTICNNNPTPLKPIL